MSLFPGVSVRIGGSSGSVGAMVGDAGGAGSGEAGPAGGSDGFSFASVFLVGGDVADAGVEPDGVVVLALDGELGAQHVDVLDELEVGLLDLEVPEQRLDPGLVGTAPGCRRCRDPTRSRRGSCLAVSASATRSASMRSSHRCQRRRSRPVTGLRPWYITA